MFCVFHQPVYLRACQSVLCVFHQPVCVPVSLCFYVFHHPVYLHAYQFMLCIFHQPVCEPVSLCFVSFISLCQSMLCVYLLPGLSQIRG